MGSLVRVGVVHAPAPTIVICLPPFTRAAMIFHLRNHYAVIYAIRDYERPDGVRCKEILTARRGQVCPCVPFYQLFIVTFIDAIYYPLFGLYFDMWT